MSVHPDDIAALMSDVPLAEIEEAMRDLEAIGLTRRNPDGTWDVFDVPTPTTGLLGHAVQRPRP